MKKILYTFLSLALLVSFSFTSVYADMGGSTKKQKTINENIEYPYQQQENDEDELENDEDELENDEDELENDEDELENDEDDVSEDAYRFEKIEALKIQFKENHKDKTLRKELLREILRIKKENNDNSRPVLINGQELKSALPPVIKGDKMLIPVRAVTNALGAVVSWDETTRTATITKTVTDPATGTQSTITIKIELDSNIVLVNGQEVQIDAPAELNNESTYVPLRFIAETFKQKVEWDEETGSVIIEDEDETTPTPTPAQ